jgi:hypothetical protein
VETAAIAGHTSFVIASARAAFLPADVTNVPDLFCVIPNAGVIDSEPEKAVPRESALYDMVSRKDVFGRLSLPFPVSAGREVGTRLSAETRCLESLL